jgi:hypothetical protein
MKWFHFVVDNLPSFAHNGSRIVKVPEPLWLLNHFGFCRVRCQTGGKGFMDAGTNRFFQASEIARLIGMPEKRLIKFVESPGYGIKPSVRTQAGKGAPRLYSLNDCLRVALAWWLFQAGFRSQVIGRVLSVPAVAKSLVASSEWNAKTAGRRYLVVKREMAIKEPPDQEVSVMDLEQAFVDVKSTERHGFQILPIGPLLSLLWSKLRTTGE